MRVARFGTALPGVLPELPCLDPSPVRSALDIHHGCGGLSDPLGDPRSMNDCDVITAPGRVARPAWPAELMQHTSSSTWPTLRPPFASVSTAAEIGTSTAAQQRDAAA